MEGLKNAFNEARETFSTSTGVQIWSGETESDTLNRTSFGARSAIGFFGAVLLMVNSKSRPLAGLMLGSAAILREGVILMLKDYKEQEPKDLDANNRKQNGFAPVLKAVEVTVALHALGTLLGNLKGQAGIGKILISMTTFGGVTAWNAFLFTQRTTKEKNIIHKESEFTDKQTPAINWKNRFIELFDFPNQNCRFDFNPIDT
ncbi:MAG: hypothetical protein JSR80_05400 [Verrucomicrobia bacterium]|nr:hypothetical protein [Verrucomicrobiota bacterium]